MMIWRNVLAGALALGLVLGAVPGQAPAQTATLVGQTAVATGAPTLAGSPVSSRADLAAAFATKADIASPAFSGVATFQDVTINGTLRGVNGFLPLGGGALTGGLSGTTGSFSGALSGGTLNVTNNATVGGTLGVTGALTGTSETLTGNLTGTNSTFSSSVTAGGNTVVSPAFVLNGNGTGQLGLRFLANGLNRWREIVTNAEGGNNTGSDYILQTYTDAGAFLSNLQQITRATGAFTHNSSFFAHQTSNDNSEPGVGQSALAGWLHISGGSRDAPNRMGGNFTVDNAGYTINLDPNWVTGHTYSINDIVNTNGYLSQATSAGVSGATPPNCSAAVPTCSDGVVSWKFIGTLGSSYQMIGAFASATIASSYGGVPGAPIGTAFGFNTQANISVLNAAGVVGYELNYGTAFPVYSRVGLQIIGGTLGVAQGTDLDVALRIGAQTSTTPGVGSAPMKHLIDLGAVSDFRLLDPNGTLLRVHAEGWNAIPAAPTVMAGAAGLDLTEFQPTGVGEFGGGFILRGPGSQILGSGDFQSNFALLHQTATGASLDVSQYHVTGVSIHAGGGGTDWVSAGYFATCSDGSLVKATTASGGVITGVSLVIGSYSSTPQGTATCTSEYVVGTPDNAGNARLPTTQLTIDTTSTLANTGAPVLSLGGVALVTAATAAPGTNTTQLATTAFSAAAVAVETSRATTAEALLAPKASPTFTGTVTIPAGASISGFAPLASPTFTGTINAGTIVATGAITGQSGLTAGTNTAAQPVFINGQAGANRNLIWQTAGVKRFQIFINTAAEAGANVGSDVNMAVSDDTGTTIFTPISITRSTGLTTMNNLSATMTGGTINNAIIGGSTPLAGTFTTLTASSIKVGANQVVGARQTGWTAMTGTPDLATAFATSTVTLAQLAGRVMSLQAAMTTHGLIGP